MAIKISNTTVIDDSRNIVGINTLQVDNGSGRLTVTPGTTVNTIASTNTGGVASNILRYTASEHQWQIGGSTVMRLDDSENLYLGIGSERAWGNQYRVIQLGTGSALWAATNGSSSSTYLSSNVFFDNTNYTFLNNNNATYYLQSAGTHKWYTAPSAGAGNTATFTERMALDLNGNLNLSALTASKAVFTDASKNLTTTGTLAIDQGGTGATTLTANSLIVGNGTSAVQLIAPGTSGNLLVSDGTSWQSTTNLSASINLQDNQVIRPLFKDYALVHNVLGSISGAQTIDLTLGNFVSATIAGATQFTFSNPPSGTNAGGFILELTNGGSGTITWPSVKWPKGVAPTLTAAGVDILAFITDDAGTTWRGVLSMQDSK